MALPIKELSPMLDSVLCRTLSSTRDPVRLVFVALVPQIPGARRTAV